MNARDERSVGELLLDADFTTRQVLMDVTGDDVQTMLRTWGEVVQSASELWATLSLPVERRQWTGKTFGAPIEWVGEGCDVGQTVDR